MLTTRHFKTLDDLYDYYNKVLFEGELPDCIINMSSGSSSSTARYFSYQRWKKQHSPDEKFVHEISLTPYGLSFPEKEWHATLVHEMCHLWQHEIGTPSRPGYHNHQWADKMEAVGLMPSNTGLPGGKKVGQQMADYPIEGGRFEKAFNDLTEQELDSLRLKYLPVGRKYSVRVVVSPAISDNSLTISMNSDEEGSALDSAEEPKPRSGKRSKYTCSCGNNIWGKGGLSVRCNECNCNYVES